MQQGLVKISSYEQLTSNQELKKLETFSENFLDKNSEILKIYARRWASDPLHQWSRIWEYPFTAHAINRFVARSHDKKLRILDAGSGITFFPYFLKSRFSTLDIDCLDYDPKLPELYAAVNNNSGLAVDFKLGSMVGTRFDSESFDLIYCISVLEHTSNYPDIIHEFKRLLKPGGQLIVTFDISLDKRADIPLHEARELLTSLQNEFTADDLSAVVGFENAILPLSNIVATGYVKRVYPDRLPWKYPRSSGMLAALRKRTLPLPVMKKLTFACFTFSKL